MKIRNLMDARLGRVPVVEADPFPRTTAALAAIPGWHVRRRELLVAYRDEVGAEALERQLDLGKVRFECCWSLRSGDHAAGCRREDGES